MVNIPQAFLKKVAEMRMALMAEQNHLMPEGDEELYLAARWQEERDLYRWYGKKWDPKHI